MHGCRSRTHEVSSVRRIRETPTSLPCIVPDASATGARRSSTSSRRRRRSSPPIARGRSSITACRAGPSGPRRRHRLGARRSARAHHGRVRHDSIVHQSLGACAAPIATPETGLTARALIGDLRPGQDVFYRVRFEDLADCAHRQRAGRRATSARRRRRAGRCASRGRPTPAGRAGASTPRAAACACSRPWPTPSPICSSTSATRSMPTSRSPRDVTLDDGTLWRNIVTPAKSKVAETLDEFRGNHLYNRLDEHYRRFAARGRPGRDVGRPRSPRQLVSDAGAAAPGAVHGEARRGPRGAGAAGVPRALSDARWTAAPTRASTASIPFGPLVEVFALDMRSYRGANNENLQTVAERRHARSWARRRRSGWPTRWRRSTRHVEDRGRRHAARPGRRPSARPPRSRRQRRRRPAARPRARDRRTAEDAEAAPRPQRGVDHRGRALLRRAPLRPGARGGRRTSIRSGSSSPARRTPARSRRRRSTPRSVPRCASTACRGPAAQPPARVRACSSSACSTPTRGRGADRVARQHRGAARLHAAARGRAIDYTTGDDARLSVRCSCLRYPLSPPRNVQLTSASAAPVSRRSSRSTMPTWAVRT